MSNYVLWKNDYGDEMVEVRNESELPEVQKVFTAKGYLVESTFRGIYGHWFFVIRKPESGWEGIIE